MGISALSTNDIWAVGTFTTQNPWHIKTLVLHWDGTSWTQFDSPNLTIFDSLIAVDAISPTDVWAVGAAASGYDPSGPSGPDQTLIEHWDGTSWALVKSPNPKLVHGDRDDALLGVSGVSATDAWAVGYSGGGITTVILHWDGTRWTHVRSPRHGRTDELYGVQALSSADAWAVGTTKAYHSLVLHWDGTRWTRVPSPSPGWDDELRSVGATSPTDVITVGDFHRKTTIPHELVERWNGRRWRRL